MGRLLLARAARQPAAQEIGPERDHRIVRFEREAAPRRRLIAGWHGRPAGVRMSGETARARAERQEPTARWVDRPRRQRRSRSAAAGIAWRPDLRPAAARCRHAIRDATPGRLARTAHDGTPRRAPIRPGKDNRPYFEARSSLPAKSAFFRPSAIGRMVRSTVFVSTSIRPSSKNTVRPAQWPSIYLIASTRLDRLGRSARAVISLVFRASMIGFVSACRTARRSAALRPRIRASIA